MDVGTRLPTGLVQCLPPRGLAAWQHFRKQLRESIGCMRSSRYKSLVASRHFAKD